MASVGRLEDQTPRVQDQSTPNQLSTVDQRVAIVGTFEDRHVSHHQRGGCHEMLTGKNYLGVERAVV